MNFAIIVQLPFLLKWRGGGVVHGFRFFLNTVQGIKMLSTGYILRSDDTLFEK